MNLPETSADGFANLTQYNKTKLLAKMAFKRYYSLKTCNVEFTHFKYTKQHTCESLTNFFRNLNFGVFYIQMLLSVVAS